MSVAFPIYEKPDANVVKLPPKVVDSVIDVFVNNTEFRSKFPSNARCSAYKGDWSTEEQSEESVTPYVYEFRQSAIIEAFQIAAPEYLTAIANLIANHDNCSLFEITRSAKNQIYKLLSYSCIRSNIDADENDSFYEEDKFNLPEEDDVGRHPHWFNDNALSNFFGSIGLNFTSLGDNTYSAADVLSRIEHHRLKKTPKFDHKTATTVEEIAKYAIRKVGDDAEIGAE